MKTTIAPGVTVTSNGQGFGKTAATCISIHTDDDPPALITLYALEAQSLIDFINQVWPDAQ